MKYITFGDFEQKANYLVKDLGKGFAVLEISDEDIADVKNQVECIEPDFEIKIHDIDWNDLGELKNEKVLVATIGQEFISPDMQYTYNIQEKQWIMQNKIHSKGIWIHCYSPTKSICASQLLITLNKLCLLRQLLGRFLVIIGDLESVLPYFSKNSLTQKVIDTYLESRQSFMLRSDSHSARYHQQKIKERLIASAGNRVSYSLKKSNPLYNNIFYDQIPENQKIYLPINLLKSTYTIDNYERLGIHVISIGSRYTFFYSKKQIIDMNKDILINNVYPNYENPILTKAPIQKGPVGEDQHNHNMDTNVQFTGKDVLIGLITESGLDYMNPELQDVNGKTRIFNYWIQTDGDSGIEYTEEQINEALLSETPNEIVPLEQGEKYATTILSLAGGGQEGIEFMATDSKFIVHKINKASKTLQAIYGGDTKEDAVLMPDILIAADRMINLATEYSMPLVLIVPYNTNFSAHDGTSVYERILGRIGRQQGCTIIVPTGDEGNKAHHVSIVRNQSMISSILFKTMKPTENVRGCIHLTNFGEFKAEFYFSDQKQFAIRLDEEGTYRINGTTIYTSGVMTNFDNGACKIDFKIENMRAGKWQLNCQVKTIQASTKVDLWLGQQALNPNVILDPSTTTTTLGSNAAITNLLSVGAFDHHHLVVLALSGRGYNWNDDVVPICAILGKITIEDNNNESCDIEGTIISASFLAGIMALFYERWVRDKGKPYANSIVMQKRFINYLKQFSGLEYPNPGQGYGVFELQNIAKLIQ